MPDPLIQGRGQAGCEHRGGKPGCGPGAGLTVGTAGIVAPAALCEGDHAAAKSEQYGKSGGAAQGQSQQAE